MIRSFIVESTCNNMRIDRWLRNKLGKVPQSLIEKSLRLGKIKINKKKIKSSFKIKTNDKIELFNIDFKEKAIFSLNLDVEKKVGTLSTLEMEVDKEGTELKKRKTTTFIIQD